MAAGLIDFQFLFLFLKKDKEKPFSYPLSP
jgi:hypothetical protein